MVQVLIKHKHGGHTLDMQTLAPIENDVCKQMIIQDAHLGYFSTIVKPRIGLHCFPYITGRKMISKFSSILQISFMQFSLQKTSFLLLHVISSGGGTTFKLGGLMIILGEVRSSYLLCSLNLQSCRLIDLHDNSLGNLLFMIASFHSMTTHISALRTDKLQLHYMRLYCSLNARKAPCTLVDNLITSYFNPIMPASCWHNKPPISYAQSNTSILCLSLVKTSRQGHC